MTGSPDSPHSATGPMADDSPGALGIIAGGGQFPFLVAEEARRAGRRVVAVGLAGNVDPALAGKVDAFQTVKIGQLGRLIRFLTREGCSQAAMAGTVNKARAMDMRPDWRGAMVYLRLRARGDDALLRGITAEIESEGITVVAAHSLVPGLTTPAGVLTRRGPTPQERQDIAFGWRLAKRLGELDVGQTLVVKRGVVAAVEALEGTNACIERGGKLAGTGCVVVKVFKPGQEERVDMPALGLGTVEVMAAAGAGCLVAEAGRSLFFDREAAVAAADAASICIAGLDWRGDPPDGFADPDAPGL